MFVGLGVACTQYDEYESSSIRQGVFPNELKLAKVLPIYKSDDKRQLKNYRSISVLPFI